MSETLPPIDNGLPGDWDLVVGVEIHVQLATASKLLTSAAVATGDPPNTHIDPLTLGLPGALPTINAEAVRLAVRLGLALGCEIDLASEFARKHYFYADLPKGYQVTQFDRPICRGGAIPAVVDGALRSFALERIHLEEDAGKTVHDAASGVSRVDLNRAGTCLVEVVGKPVLRTPAEVVAAMKGLHQVVTALGVSDGDLERGNFRCDANVSVRPHPGAPLGTRTEIKNVNSFRFVGRAVAYEAARQVDVLRGGGTIAQQTRLWDEAAGRTRAMRSKEDAHDYRYFPEPDLMPVVLSPADVEAARAALPELPLARWQRFQGVLGLSAYDADVLIQEPERADYFEAAVAAATPGGGEADVSTTAKVVTNWVTGELLAAMKDLTPGDDGRVAFPVPADALGELAALQQAGKLSSKLAKQCFQAMLSKGVRPAAWVAEHGGTISDPDVIRGHIAEVLDAHPGEVAQFLGGKTKVQGFFVGQVMKRTRGRANPGDVNRLLREALEARRDA